MRIIWHDDLLTDRSGLLSEIKRESDKTCKKAAHIYMRAAKAACPVGKVERQIAAAAGKSWGIRRPGNLRESIRVAKSRYKDGGWLVLIGGYDTYYWSFVEWGTWHIPDSYKYRNFMLKTFKKVKHMMGSLKVGR